MKKWFLEHFLPMWAKQTVLRENCRLTRENQELSRDNERLRCYIRGIHMALRGRRAGGKYEAS